MPDCSSPNLTTAVQITDCMSPDTEDLWFIPLGGCGEIGMNLNLYGHDDQWLIVDCGIAFSAPASTSDKQTTGADTTHSNQKRRGVVMADPGFVAERRDKIAGMIITHAHEDHVGAIPYLWPQLKCPIYTTHFTAHVLRRKLAEFDLLQDVEINVVSPRSTIDIHAFTVEWISMTHSVPDCHALLISTRAGTVFHTGDWKLDQQPVVGDGFDENRLRELCDVQIDAMVTDSTNADVEGSTPSEGELFNGLNTLVANAPGRVIATLFGSNLARVATLAKVAAQTDRHLGMLGRSMINMVNSGKATGLISAETSIVEAQHLGYLPPESLLLLVTGSQGEPRAALNRLSMNTFRNMQLEAGDTVIFSSRVIPGNELEVQALVERLESLGVTVFNESNASNLIHASGHPAQQELLTLYDWVKPDMVIPVHGEAHHMQHNAAIARQAGIARQIQGENGDLFVISPNKAIRRSAVPAGRLYLDGKKLVASID